MSTWSIRRIKSLLLMSSSCCLTLLTRVAVSISHRGSENPQPARQVDTVKRAVDRATLGSFLLAASPAHQRVLDDHDRLRIVVAACRQLAEACRSVDAIDVVAGHLLHWSVHDYLSFLL